MKYWKKTPTKSEQQAEKTKKRQTAAALHEIRDKRRDKQSNDQYDTDVIISTKEFQDNCVHIKSSILINIFNKLL